MKSKSFDQKRNSYDKVKQNKTFDFSSYYKSAAETISAAENVNLPSENINKDTKLSKNKNGMSSKHERTPNKVKNKLEPLDISHIDIEGPSLNTSVAKGALNDSKLTSTPQAPNKGQPKMKSIMKNKTIANGDESVDSSMHNTSSKSKKRNKSVSFMLDDTEQVVVKKKKVKSNESFEKKTETPKKAPEQLTNEKKNKKVKKDVSGKENKRSDNLNSDTVPESKKKTEKTNLTGETEDVNGNLKDETGTNKDKKKFKKDKVKKLKKQNSYEQMEIPNESNNDENKNRKAKKKKHSPKVQENAATSEGEGEPAAKAQKRDNKPEAIVENLESLTISDNPHTLSNLLDEMTVVDEDKKKKNKQKLKTQNKTPASTPNDESTDVEKTEEVKEKVKWKKRKWNKDKKGNAEEDVTSTSIIVDNLPLSMMFSYRKQLADHFGKHGLIKKIGVAEVYPAEESKPVFTTSIQFYSETAAKEALEEDQSEIEGSRCRVRKALPATQTTLVVRSYAPLSDQNVSSAFAAAGRIRSIRHLVKGKKAIATAFVEFDGPEALQRALELGAGARVAGKKVYAARFELRPHKAKAAAQGAPTDRPDQLHQPAQPAQESDSEDSD